MKFYLVVFFLIISILGCKEEKTIGIESKLEKTQNDEVVSKSASGELNAKENGGFDKKAQIEKVEVRERVFEIQEVKEEKKEIVSKKKAISKKKQVEKVRSVPKILKKGKLQFNQEVFDFGFIEMGEIVDYSFNFRNTGKKDVIISNATATCGCTTPIYPFIPIEPGQSSKIDVRFNSNGRLGNQIATIKVISDAEEPIQELTIKGVVRTEIVSPSEFIDSTRQ